MLICFGKRATKLKEQVRQLESLILLLWPILTDMVTVILYGSKSKLEENITFKAAGRNGASQRYRLTISLDLLAGSEKNDVGLNKTTTASSGAEKGENGE